MEVTAVMPSRFAKSSICFLFAAGASAAALHGLHNANHLLFHSLCELAMAGIASNIYVIAWNTKGYCSECWFQGIGVVYLCIAVALTLHALSSPSMGVFESSSLYGTQIWVLTQTLEALPFLVLPVIVNRRVPIMTFLVLSMVVTAFGLAIAFARDEPSSNSLFYYQMGICIVLFASAILLFLRSRFFDHQVMFWLTTAITMSFTSAIIAMLNHNSYPTPDVLSHSLRLIAYIAVFKAVVQNALLRPFAILFRDLRENEVARKKSDAAYRQIVETTQEGVWVLDRHSRTSYVNNQMARMLGHSIDELLGTRFEDYITSSTDNSMNSYTEASAQQPERYDLRLRRKDGNELWVSVATTPLFDIDNTIVGSFSLVSDIDFRKQTEEELKSLAEAKDYFISIASHELKTPLTVLLANLQFLYTRQDSLQKDQRHQLIDTLILQGKKLNRLINDLLDMSRAASGQLVLQLDLMNLSSLVESIIADGRAAFKTHDIRCYCERDIMVIADAGRLEQVISNLISNAVRYSSPGSEVSVSMRVDGEFVGISVTDQGCGIERDEIPQLFERYYRSKSARVGVSSGMGLGLYVTREIVERHGGTIAVESKLGYGSTFAINLPIHPAIPAQEKTAEA